MKITVEAVPTLIVGTGNTQIKNFVYLNDIFEGPIGYIGKIEFEYKEGPNKLEIKNSHGKNIIKFEASDDIHFWIITNVTTFNKKKNEVYYKGNDLKILEIKEEF